MTDHPPTRREMGILLAIGQVGMEMVVPIGLGYLVDRWLGTLPWCAAAGAILGFLGGMVHLLVLVNKLDRSDRPNPRDDS